MGVVYLIGYIVVIGLGTFLMKYGMKYVDAYQMNLIMAIAMLVITVPAVWLVHHSFKLPRAGLGIAAAIGAMMAVGSILFVLALSKLPAGLTAAIATAYVLVVVGLSWWFLKESIGWVRLVGIGLTLVGIALISLKS